MGLRTCRLRRTALPGCTLCLRRASSQGKTQGAHHTHYRAELGIACLAERFIYALSVQFGCLGNLAHATRLGHKAKCIPHEVCVTGFQCCRDVSRLFLLGVEKVGSIESCRLEHYNLSANSRARLISCCCVRLSPAHNRITISVPRRT